MSNRIFGSIFPHEDFRKYDKQTTDATVTTVVPIALAEGDTCFVLAKAYVTNDDGSKVGCFYIGGLFSRASAGNVTQEGSTQDIYAEYTEGSTINLTLAADTENQTIDCNVTGEVGETFDWTVEVQENMIVRPS